ncbi:MAG TPA: porin family protein [Burkholderiaceae bacterium]|nr:porin family protein [Burkholderiaceae bacterium]
MKKTQIAAAALLLAGLGSTGAAMAQTAQGPYVGATAGVSRFSVDCTGTTTCDKSGTAFKLYGGMNFNEIFGAEVSYNELGKAKGTVLGVGVENKVRSFDVAGTARYPVSNDVSVFGKLGMGNIRAKVSAAGLSESDSSWQPVVGVGVNWNLSKEFALRAELENRRYKFQGEKDTINTFSVGAQMNF